MIKSPQTIRSATEAPPENRVSSPGISSPGISADQPDYLSRFDRLTDVLAETVTEAIKYRTPCGFLVVAVNNIRRITDLYGFAVADEVIAAVAERLRALIRGNDHLAHFAGDRFAIVLRQCTADDMAVAAERLLAGAREGAVQTTAGPVAASVTIGGVAVPRYAQTVGEVLSRAQEALDVAQAKTLNGAFHAYQPTLRRDALRRQRLRTSDEIVSALNGRRIHIAFEPVVVATTRQPAFYACLPCLRRPDGGLIPAARIVPDAERLGLLPLLDHRVLELLVDEMLMTAGLSTSLKASLATIHDPDWWSGLSAALRAHSELASRLLIEVAATAATQDLDETRRFIGRAKDLGCRIAIDNCGVGDAFVRSLRKLGVDVVKIDGSLIEDVTRRDDDCAAVQSFLDFAHRLSLQTAACGVQDEETAQLMGAWGCDYLQGALIGTAEIERPWLVPKPRNAVTAN